MLSDVSGSDKLVVVQDPHSGLKFIYRVDHESSNLDAAAITAQYQLPGIQGQQNTWFAGAWTGYGFHEDGLKSGLAVATDIMRVSGMHARASQAA